MNSCLRVGRHMLSGSYRALLRLYIVEPKSSLLFFYFLSLFSFPFFPPSLLPLCLSSRTCPWLYIFEGILCRCLHYPESHWACAVVQRQLPRRGLLRPLGSSLPPHCEALFLIFLITPLACCVVCPASVSLWMSATWGRFVILCLGPYLGEHQFRDSSPR